MVVPFHGWTTCGPRQLHAEFGPNIRTTSISAGPLSFIFSRFTIQNFRLQFDSPPPLCSPLNKIENRQDTIFYLWEWNPKGPGKPCTKFGLDILWTLKNLNILISRKYSSTEAQFFSFKFSVFEICIYCLKMHHNAPFWNNVLKISRGRPPGPPHTLPLSALRASVKPSASGLGAPAVLNRAPEEKKLDTPA